MLLSTRRLCGCLVLAAGAGVNLVEAWSECVACRGVGHGGGRASRALLRDGGSSMQRLRTTFKRSRTPTGAEMKTQSSLEVPKQVRSASFDEIQLEAQRSHQLSSTESTILGGLLRVPQFNSQRSKSVDSGGSEESVTYLEVPRRFQRRRSSGTKSPVCVHCACLEEYNRRQTSSDSEPAQSSDGRSFSFSDDTSSSDQEDDDVIPPPPPTPCLILEDDVILPECCITVTLSPTLPCPPDSPPPTPSIVEHEPLPLPILDENGSVVTSPQTRERRRSIQRQEAFFAEPSGNSLENVSDGGTSEAFSEGTSDGVLSDGSATAVILTTVQGLIVRDIYLQVPDLKRDRAASVDSCFSKVPSSGKTEELQHSGVSLEVPVSPNVALRSRSVDIVLPTTEQARYKALAMTNSGVPPTPTTPGPASAIPAEVKGRLVGDSVGTEARALRCTPDWSEAAVNGDHLWVPTSVSGDFCYVGDNDCTKHGPRVKCSGCNVVAHISCIPALMDRVRFTCKPTFRDVGIRAYREQTTTHHHWVHRRQEKGKCRQCGKSFQSKLSFSTKEIVALSCSWCKAAYHNKETCFNIQRIGEECSLGAQGNIIVPPSWIIKLPRKGSFKSSLRKSPKKRTSSKKRTKEKDKDQRTFVIKPIPSATITPVIVFINPRSGGNQGAKLLQKFQWLLNPRQVFDLTQGGPRAGLELFRKVPQLRVLACGGDGTVGWVLSVLDQINIDPPPAVGVLPLGTGNDLARALGWGGGYTDEPISKILSNIGDSETIFLDRWSLQVEKNPNAEPNEEGKENLPLNVVNNYFSLGVDAHIALEFHEAREAHPERFNSRLRNKMFYGQAGGKDLLRRKWKGLAEFVTLECDGKDMTPKLKEHKVHAIVFLNIPSYGGGTHPWNRSGGAIEPSTDDGLIEVVGLTTYQLPLLQAGGHGTCITQCKSAKIITSKTIPMQVDGEACKLTPSIINMTLLNKATMLAKRKGGKPNIPQTALLDNVKITVHRIGMADYEQHHYDKELLSQAAICMGSIEVNPVWDLEQVRAQINKLGEESGEMPKLSPDWCFVDSCTAERFFRVDRAQEHLHYVSDVASETLFILEMEGGTLPQSPEDETALPSPSSNHQTPYIIPEMKVSNDSSLESPSDQPPLSPGLVLPTEVTIIPKSKSNNFSNDRQVTHIPSETSVKIRSIHERLFGLNQDAYGYSNLMEKTSDGILKAAKIGDLKMLKETHAQGYSMLTTDVAGQTALHYAARYGHKDIVKYIIGCAPSSLINQTDVNLGQTALHKAAANKWRNICCMLVAAGATLSITDHRGMTARMLAVQADDHELAAYLESQEHFQLVAEDMGTVV